MEEVLFNPWGSWVSFLWFFLPWVVFFVIWLYRVRRYERDPVYGLSRRVRIVGGAVCSSLYIGLIYWAFLASQFWIVRVVSDNRHVELVGLFPHEVLQINAQDIRSVQSRQIWTMLHYTGGNGRRLVIETKNGETYFSVFTSAEWAERQAEKLNHLLGLPNPG